MKTGIFNLLVGAFNLFIYFLLGGTCLLNLILGIVCVAAGILLVWVRLDK